MKRIVMMMSVLGMMIMSAVDVQAQNVTTMTRSEQFILDSLALALDKASVEAQKEMYADSLEQVVRLHLTEAQADKLDGIVVPLAFFVVVVLIVWISLWISYRKKKARYDIIEKAIEQGMSIPEGLFDEPQKTKEHTWLNTLRSAAVLIGIGIGIIGLGFFVEEDVFMGLSCIPIFLGLGYLIVALFERREKKMAEKSKDEDKEFIFSGDRIENSSNPDE